MQAIMSDLQKAECGEVGHLGEQQFDGLQVVVQRAMSDPRGIGRPLQKCTLRLRV